jgi:hypothetical protein
MCNFIFLGKSQLKGQIFIVIMTSICISNLYSSHSVTVAIQLKRDKKGGTSSTHGETENGGSQILGWKSSQKTAFGKPTSRKAEGKMKL